MALLGKKDEKTNVPLLGGRREDESVATRPGEVHTLLGKGSEFEGKLTFEGQVRIDGKFNGQIVTKDVLVIGDGARVQAQCPCGGVRGQPGAEPRAGVHTRHRGQGGEQGVRKKRHRRGGGRP